MRKSKSACGRRREYCMGIGRNGPFAKALLKNNFPISQEHSLKVRSFSQTENEWYFPLGDKKGAITVLFPCGGYLAHPFANQMDLLLGASCFSELWHLQIKEYKSISRVYLYHAEHTLFIFSFGGS